MRCRLWDTCRVLCRRLFLAFHCLFHCLSTLVQVRLWDTATGKFLGKLGQVWSIRQFGTPAPVDAPANWCAMFTSWATQLGGSHEGHTDSVYSVAFSPDGQVRTPFETHPLPCVSTAFVVAKTPPFALCFHYLRRG